jgi:hypothetical protein
MELLGVEMGNCSGNGNFWKNDINEWFKDMGWDLSDLAMGVFRSEECAEVLNKFQDIVLRAGCTNIEQVEYIYHLENRLDSMDLVIKSLCDQHP